MKKPRTGGGASPAAGTTPYKPTPREAEALGDIAAHYRQRAPRMLVETPPGGGGLKLSVEHPDASVGMARLMQALGTSDIDFYQHLLDQLLDVTSEGQQADEGALNAMLAVVVGVRPRDQLEAMLAAQMAAVHNATMALARRLAHVETIPQQDSAERAFNKLARTFVSQLAALKAYRSGGQQHVTVTHLNVAAHQAQVNVGSGPGGGTVSTSEGQPHAPRTITYEPGETLPREIEAVGEAVPSACG